MVYILFILLSLALLLGFLALTTVETRRGVRVFAPLRAKLDELAQASEELSRVDLAVFVLHLLRDATHRVLHDLAHLSLLLIRAIERELTRLVKHVRSNRTPIAPEMKEQSPVKKAAWYVRKALQKSRETETTPAGVE